MKKEHYFEERANLVALNRKLRFVIFVLALAIVINGFFVYSSGVHQKIVLIPPYIEGEAYVYGKDASDFYLKSMGSYVAFLRLNYTPGSADRQFNAFLRLLPPEVFKSYQVTLYKLKDKIKSLRISSAFFPSRIEIDRKHHFIFVQGILNQWTYDKKFLTDEERVYGVKYRIDNGRFYVLDFRYCGNNKSGCLSRVEKK